MTTTLQGGVRVCALREGFPWERGTAKGWSRFGRRHGAEAISLRALELAPGRSPRFDARGCDEVLYVLEGRGRVFVDGTAVEEGTEIGPDTGILVAEGRAWAVDNPGPEPVLIASSRCPEPEAEPAPDTLPPGAFEPEADASARTTPPVVRLADREKQTTADRWYFQLLDPEAGCERVTQFVGCIPPGRAPDHFHHYEEVIVIRSGKGVLWAGDGSAPIERDSCIFLPRKQVHCLENTGTEPMVLLGVFYPAGSPADRDEDDPPA